MGAVCCSQVGLDLEGEVDLSHFTLLRSVGKGAFGKVRVVQHKGTKKLFALKYINKTKCIQMRAVENIISERRILEQVSYGLIVNLRYAFQDDDNLFMVLDLMLGGDLRFHLDRLGVMPESYVQFYAAEVAISLRHLHNNKVIHRDIKPDNILLNEHGHAHLTDFNIAVQFTDSKPLTSIAGSMAYMAPEVLAKRGYGVSVDWWSLGVVCFELMFGKRPFRGKTNDALQHAIMHEPLCFPENSRISHDAMDFVKGLLTRDVSRRLGVKDKGFTQLVNHPWLRNIQWDLLESKQACPPFIPDSKRANFDPTHELEEILLEDNPLIVRKRNPKRSAASHANTSLKSQSINDIPETSPERQTMDEKFLVYDYTKPEENEWRKREMEQRRWAQKMTKTNQEHYHTRTGRISGGAEKPQYYTQAHPQQQAQTQSPQQLVSQMRHPQQQQQQQQQQLQQPPPRGSSAKVGSTYKTSVTDYVNQKPATPLSEGDLLKMEELARMARAGVGKDRGTDWRPPSGILPPSTSYTDPATSTLYEEYISRTGDESEQNTLPHHHNRRRSSDESYPTSASPETSERPLVRTASSSFASLEQTHQYQQQQQRYYGRQQPQPQSALPPLPPDPPFAQMAPTPPLSQSGEDDTAAYYNRSYSLPQQSSNKPSTRPMSPNSSSKAISSVSSLSLRQYPPTVDQIPPPLAPPTSLPPPVPSALPPPPAAVSSPLHYRRSPPS
ncbi:kinase-like domain-containing protein [Phascolomyces articulosus]|uniref:Kinase-like domain-containing protein n=1 Tax=Phascolomyces articulosus TaxID=60185 RepID=A0AAD5JNC6_9FUNG|nr:kinase-like domain-containing protein [Phascolomyces articulosus]